MRDVCPARGAPSSASLAATQQHRDACRKSDPRTPRPHEDVTSVPHRQASSEMRGGGARKVLPSCCRAGTCAVHKVWPRKTAKHGRAPSAAKTWSSDDRAPRPRAAEVSGAPSSSRRLPEDEKKMRDAS